MSSASSEPGTIVRMVRFSSEIAQEAPNKIPTTVEIFPVGDGWYCHVRRGDQKTQSMGPYTRLQAEAIQDARRLLLSKKGTARLMFEQNPFA
jgi:hypothetical protein